MEYIRSVGEIRSSHYIKSKAAGVIIWSSSHQVSGSPLRDFLPNTEKCIFAPQFIGMRKSLFPITAFIIVLTWIGCSDPVYTPKPRSFPRVDFPEKAYEAFTEDYCNFTFERPVYTEIQQDTVFFKERPPDDCWFDVFYPAFDGRIHFTYVSIPESNKTLDDLREEAFGMADWHNKRANYIDELLINTDNGVSGIAFDIDGPAASPFQFFLTDSVQHYVRASLYFNTQTRADSLAPVIDFVRTDILHMIETFEWK